MSTQKTSILILRTINSKNTDFENTINTLTKDSSFHSVLCKDLPSAKKILGEDKFNIVVVHCNTLQDEPNLWRKVLYEAKARNKFSEIIVIISDKDPQKKIEASDVLTSGCFAFFQHDYNEEVLLGYIAAAEKKSNERKSREQFSQELSKHVLLKDVVKKIVEQFDAITTYDNITISLLKEDENNQGYLRKLLYTNIPEEEIKWDLLGPTNKDELIQKILSEKITRRVFPDVTTDVDIQDLFNKDEKTPNIKSWIALPLKHAGKPIGLITLDSKIPKHFNYEKINEVALERIANQAATALQYAERDNSHTKLVSALNALEQSNSLDETLKKLAKEACELVDGLFSYIVTPDNTNSYLSFKGVWSRHYGDAYIEQLERRVNYFDKKNNITIRGAFEINSQKKDIGITVVAYQIKETQLLENIQNKVPYKESNLLTRDAYFEFIYNDEKGKRLDSNTDIAIPIVNSEKQVLGVINVEHENPFAFTKEQITALEILASFASIAISRDIKQKLTKDLYQFSDFQFNEESSFADIKIFLESIAEKVRKISNAEYVSVFSVKDNVSFIVGTANKPPNMLTEGARPFTAETMGHTGWSVKHKLPVIIPNTKEYKDSPSVFRDINGKQYIRENNIPIDINPKTEINFVKALMCLPMILPSRQVNGVIWLHYVNNPNYTKEQIELFQILANRAAYALHIAETLKFKNIEVKIGNATDKVRILNEIIDSTKDYFGLGGAAIYEVIPDSKRPRLKRVVSNINQFPAGEEVDYGDGLAGRLILRKDDKHHKYSQGYWHVQNYPQYAHGIDYSEEKLVELASVFGILLPHDSKLGEPIGVLIVSHREEQRTFNESLSEFKHLANSAGRHLINMKYIEDGKLNVLNFSTTTKLEENYLISRLINIFLIIMLILVIININSEINLSISTIIASSFIGVSLVGLFIKNPWKKTFYRIVFDLFLVYLAYEIFSIALPRIMSYLGL